MGEVEELTPPVQEKRRPRSWLLPLVIALFIIAALAGAFFYSGLDRSLVKRQLDQFAANLRKQGHAQGRIIEFTYRDVETAGGFTDRHALVREPKLLVKPEHAPAAKPGEANSVLVSTPVIEIYPKGRDLSAMRMVLPQPVNVSSEEEPNKSLLKISGNAPIAIDIAQSKSDDGDYLRLRQTLPAELRLTYLREQRTEGMEEATPSVVPVYQTLILTIGKAEWEANYQPTGKKLGEGRVEMRDMRIAPEKLPETAIRIGQISGQWRKALDKNQQPVFDSRLAIEPITAPPEILPQAPVSFRFDLHYEGGLPDSPQPAMNNAHLQLRTLALHMKDAAIDAKADFATSGEDIVPAGSAVLTLRNFPFFITELKKTPWLDAANEALLAELVTAISGQPYGAIHDFTIEAKREPGGSFTIGKSSFEELFTIVLKHKLQKVRIESLPAGAIPSASMPLHQQ